MGIGNQQGRVALQAIKAGTNKTQIRQQVADCSTIFQKWLNDYDARQNGAEAGFAASRPAQFDTFVDSLPDVPVDQTP